MKNFITLHIVNDIPWSNLNRDDTGTPKRTTLGGVERGLLSSQSIKRAARKDFEKRTLNLSPEGYFESYRSKNLLSLVIERAEKLTKLSGQEFNEKEAIKVAEKSIKTLTGGGGKDTLTWLSFEEIETLASVIVDSSISEEMMKVFASTGSKSKAFKHFMKERGVTGSLAIAAFGRMFANATPFQTEAAISVSPAISTHRALIETDYFTAVDDIKEADEEGVLGTAGAGAGHIDVALYTSGTFYRTVTIDIAELQANWSGKTGEHAQVQLEQFLKSLIYTLPSGKKNSTSPYGEPLLVLAEEQDYRQAYSISGAIKTIDEDGYKGKTIELLRKEYDLAREYSASNYGETIVSGIMSSKFAKDDNVSMASLIEKVSKKILTDVTI